MPCAIIYDFVDQLKSLALHRKRDLVPQRLIAFGVVEPRLDLRSGRASAALPQPLRDSPAAANRFDQVPGGGPKNIQGINQVRLAGGIGSNQYVELPQFHGIRLGAERRRFRRRSERRKGIH